MKLKDYRENLMNEQIKELAEQAKKYALDAMIKITDKEQALKVYSESYDTKFAELIVKECVTVGQDAFLHGSTVPVFPTIQIKRHFGVEE